MKKYHVFSAKNFGYESDLGDGTYDYFVFPADEFSQSDSVKVSTGPAQREKGRAKASLQTTHFARSQYNQSSLSNS